jgi:acetyl-CoA carboxylase carboxyl transferase subunit alpha
MPARKSERLGDGPWLDFEKPIVELERRIADLKEFATEEDVEFSEELKRLEKRAARLRGEIYSKLTRWQRVQLARHPRRPYTLDYVRAICDFFFEIHGDRGFADDRALVTGFSAIDGRPVMIVGHQKGRDTRENLARNFGMPHPEGYRKALRAMHMAAHYGAPIVALIDTPGAFPGIGAEERGQSEAIARNLREMFTLPVPIVVVVIGEGGSGGALAIGCGDVVLMLENAIYSVISPEGCAAILWSDRAKAPQAAESLKITAPDLLEFGIIDEIIPEPESGAHRDHALAAQRVKDAITRHVTRLSRLPREQLLAERARKFRNMGVYAEGPMPEARALTDDRTGR